MFKSNSEFKLDLCIAKDVNDYVKKLNIDKYSEDFFYDEVMKVVIKTAIWYELRFPERYVSLKYPGSGVPFFDINSELFNKSEYINSNFDVESDVRLLEFDKVYNFDIYRKGLNNRFLADVRYKKINSFMIGTKIIEIKLDKDGFIIENSGFNLDCCDMHITDLVEVLDKTREKDMCLAINKIIDDYNFEVFLRNLLMECIMKQIIVLGGNRIGPRRGFMFALEFGLNIDIPMRYAIDYSDPGLRKFINEYLKSGGDKNLICFESYFSNVNKKATIISLSDILNKERFTEEEVLLQKRLVNVLNKKL